MHYVYKRHAEEKLRETEPKRLHITKKLITKILDTPDAIDMSDEPVRIAMGKLSSHHTLCIVYRYEENVMHIITFFPARRGRYESKVLS